jgi:hypothetical protein
MVLEFLLAACTEETNQLSLHQVVLVSITDQSKAAGKLYRVGQPRS